MSLATLADLPAVDEQRGGDPNLLWKEMRYTIEQAILHAPRSQQVEIGPSEVGHPCDRRLAHKLAGTPETNVRAGWRPTVGTAVHTWLEDAFTQANPSDAPLRWLTELTVEVGSVNGQPIRGHVDLYDRVTATVIDHKVVGPTSLKAKRSKGPGEQYRTQIHLYARGLTARGLPVDTVMIVFYPQAGELTDTYVWHEPYDEQVALAGLARLEAIAGAVTALGDQAPALMSTADAFCGFCPYFQVNADDLSTACPGYPKRATKDSLTELVA